MAKTSAFVRYLELILDRASADKTEKDTQEALNKATDPKTAGKNLAQVSDGLADVSKAVEKVTETEKERAAVTRDLTDAQKAREEVEREMLDELQLLNREYASGKVPLEEYAFALAGMREAAETLGVTMSSDLGMALSETEVLIASETIAARDLSSAFQEVDYSSAALVKAHTQALAIDEKRTRQMTLMHIEALKMNASMDRTGITASRSAAGTGRLVTSLLSLTRQMTGAHPVASQLAGVIGTFAVGSGIMLAVTAGLAALSYGFKKITEDTKEAKEAAEDLREEYLRLAEQRRREDLGIAGAAKEDADALLEVLTEQRTRAAQLERDIATLEAAGNFEAAGAMARTRAQLQGEIDEQTAAWEEADRQWREAIERANESSLNAILEGQKDWEEALAGRRSSGTGAAEERLNLLIEGSRLRILEIDEINELVGHYYRLNDALKEGNLTLSDRLRITGQLAEVQSAMGIFDVELPGLAGPTATSGGLRSTTPKLATATIGNGPRSLTDPQLEGNRLLNFWTDNFDSIQNAGQMAALGIQHSFESAFSALMVEGEGLGGFFENLFRGSTAGAIAAIADLARVKVAEHAAWALEGVVQGLLGNPTGFAAAGTAAKAGLAWAAAGGLAGAASQGISSGVGAVASSHGLDLTGRAVDRLDRGQVGPEIHLHIDGVDPKNPRHQQLIGDAGREYQERYGARITDSGRARSPRTYSNAEIHRSSTG